jgi:hypothetical protein
MVGLVVGGASQSSRVVMAAIVAAAGLGCSLDRKGLGATDAAAVVHDGAGDVSMGADVTPPRDAPADMVPVDRPQDRMPDALVDLPAPCNTAAGLHRCGDACVSNASPATCGSSCTACPAPASGTATCDGTSCGIACNAGFIPHAGACLACNGQCDAGAVTVVPPGGRFTGTTSGASSSQGSCGGAAAPEAVYKLVLSAAADVFVTTHGSRFDTVVYMRRGGCCGAEVACNDNADGRTTSVLAQPNLPAGTYYIFVDGATAAAAGNFSLDVYATPPSDNAAEACGRPARISNMPVTGNSCGYRDDYDPQGGCLDMPNSSFDAVYYFVLDAAANVTFNTCSGTCIDSVLYIRDICSAGGSQRSCDDDSCSAGENCISTPAQSRTTAFLGAGVHYLVLDTYPVPQPVTCGAFTIAPVGVPP